MKKWVLCASLFVVFACAASIASADDIGIEVVSGADAALVTATSGTVMYSSANFNGWVITVLAGTGYSPSLIPYAIDLTSLVSTCVATGPCSAAPLDVYVSDIGFSGPVGAGNFVTNYTANDTGGAGTSTEAISWADSTNTQFGGAFPMHVGMDHTGTAGPFAGAGDFAGSASGVGPGEVTPFSLTIEEVFDPATSGASTFSVDSSIIATPETSSLALLTFGLLGLALLTLKRRSGEMGG